MTTSEGSRLLAAGHPITLIDGRTVNVRFGFRGLLMIEERFGCLAAVQNLISEDGTSKMVEPLSFLMAAGLTAEKIDYDDLLDLLDLRRLGEYVTALAAALNESLPTGQAGKVQGPAGSEDSPGPPSTTSEPSALVAATSSSGR